MPSASCRPLYTESYYTVYGTVYGTVYRTVYENTYTNTRMRIRVYGSVLPYSICIPLTIRSNINIVMGGLRNPHLRPRVWISECRVGTVSEQFRGSPPPKSRGASPPDLPGSVWDGFAEDVLGVRPVFRNRFRSSDALQ